MSIGQSDEETLARQFEKTKLNTVGRLKDRANYDKKTIEDIVAAAKILHVAFVDDQGLPQCVPLIGALEETPGGDIFAYFHGYHNARFAKLTADVGTPMVATASLVDGYVLALSVFHHSMNYRSAVLHGVSLPFEDGQDGVKEKLHALQLIANAAAPGSWDYARQPNEAELKSTAIVRMKVETGSAKIRVGPPKDDKKDIDDPELSSKVWTGVVPLKKIPGAPEPSSYCPPIAVPAHVTKLK